MKEHTSPGEITLEPSDHLVQPLIAHAEQRPGAALLATRRGDAFVDLSAAEVWTNVQALARGLIGLGIEPGARVAIMSHTRIEWILLDYAILAAGCVTVPIYETSSADQLEWILSDSGAVALFVEDADLRTTYGKVADQVPDCQHALVIEEGAMDTLTDAGAAVSDDELHARLDALTTDDLATIIYTSGTTGKPKGCLLTHGNLRWDAVNTLAYIGDLIRPGDSQLLFLPLAHSFAKILCMAAIERSCTVGVATSVDALTDELSMYRPTYLAAVPRIFEKVFAGARKKAHDDGKGAIFDRAAEVAERYSRESQGGSVSLAVRAQHALFDALVYRKLRAVFGGRVRSATSGGGPLGERLAHFFNGIGVPVFEGYGLTETSPVLTVNRPDRWRIGTVGQPIPGTTIRIADDGEILVKGKQVFRGYHHNDEATAETMDDGWFKTGDIGQLDDEGFLRITGRKKEIIVTAAGKNVAPAVLEDGLQSHPLVSQAMVIGDNQRFIAALVTIDEEMFGDWAEKHGKSGKSVADLVDDPDLRAEVQTAVDHANQAVSRAEAIREFRILPRDFTVEGGQLTPTLKVKRRVVEEQHGEVIADIYRED